MLELLEVGLLAAGCVVDDEGKEPNEAPVEAGL
jgi:hypothetical protein